MRTNVVVLAATSNASLYPELFQRVLEAIVGLARAAPSLWPVRVDLYRILLRCA